MQTRNRLLDDLARVAGGAVGVLSGVREEVEGRMRQQLERILQNMDLVQREEFEAVRMVASQARAEQETLAERVARLEATVAELREALARGATSAASAAEQPRAGDTPPPGMITG